MPRRGDNATEALGDLLMGPGGAGGATLLSGFVGVTVRRGIDAITHRRDRVST
ncbi:hypothetical protein OG259_00685 [Streptomyces sp. NBC_00250]|uniref:hypothetical protein n=1 Tax=Streptomyces sp. NBC_00250 TaxID=2903641 RepID=UPI002E2E17BB|nr:hypothetical protein [Streptomyces sp. NBC_00250]